MLLRGCLVFFLLLFLVPIALCLGMGNSSEKNVSSVLLMCCASLVVFAILGGGGGGDVGGKKSSDKRPEDEDAFPDTVPDNDIHRGIEHRVKSIQDARQRHPRDH